MYGIPRFWLGLIHSFSPPGWVSRINSGPVRMRPGIFTGTLLIKQVHKSSSTLCSQNNLLQAVGALCLLGNLPGRPGRPGRHPPPQQCEQTGRADFQGNVLAQPLWRSFLSGRPDSLGRIELDLETVYGRSNKFAFFFSNAFY